MSLFDGLLLDSLLNPPVMQQNYYVALRTDGVKGAGTIDDPFNGNTQALFDSAIASIPANSTIFLGPTKFDGSGNVSQPFLTNGITLKNGQKLVGSGMGVTVLKLETYPANAFKAAISSTFLTSGGEVSDLQIDANLKPSSNPDYYSSGGVQLNGRNILVTRVRVINAGSNSSTIPATAISAANANTPGEVPSNCVIDSCIVDSPSSNHSQRLNAIGLLAEPTGGTMNYHENCVIRKCFVDLGFNSVSPKDLFGIVAVGCKGTIVEQNGILNCKVGGPYQSGSATDRYASKDLVVRLNYYRKVLKGISIKLDNTSGYVFDIERVIVQQNEFEMLDSSVGIEFLEQNATENDSFKSLVIRGNIIRLNDSMSSILNGQGIVFEAGANVVCENNVVNVQNNNDSVIRRRGNALQVFNTRRPDGKFVQAYNATTGLLEQELTTEAENYLFML